MAITTLAEVKTILRISDTSKDDYINAVIPMIEGYIKDYCNNVFLDENETENYPEGLKLIAIKMIEYNLNQSGVQSEKLGDYSVTYTTDYPDFIMRGLRRYRRVSFT